MFRYRIADCHRPASRRSRRRRRRGLMDIASPISTNDSGDGRGHAGRRRDAGALPALALLLGLAAAMVPLAGGAGPIVITGDAAQEASAAAAESLLVQADRALARGEPDFALITFRQVPAGSVAYARARYGEGRSLLALGQADAAVRILRPLVAPADTGRSARELAAASAELLGLTCLRLGRTDEARRVYTRLARDFPERAEHAAVMTAQAHEQDGAYLTALRTLRPLLREGRCRPAYDLAVAISPRLEGGAQRELTGLLRDYLQASGRLRQGGSSGEERGRGR